MNRSRSRAPRLSMRRPSLSVVGAPPLPRAAEDLAAARLNVVLPAHLHAKIKARAAERGLSIRDYILELLCGDGLS